MIDTLAAEQFYYILYNLLLINCPYDTGNMLSHLELIDEGDSWHIVISGPSKTSTGEFYDYAKSVNYNAQRTPKEARNYQWIERTIRQAAEIVGGEVSYELS